MKNQNLFKWKHYQPGIILLTVKWYLQYNLSFPDLVEMMKECGLCMATQRLYIRCVHQYGPELEERGRCHLKSTNDSWRIDETYIKVKGKWIYLYHAVDSEGNTIDFYLGESRDKRTAKCFPKKALAFSYVSRLRVITVDKNSAYPVAIQKLKEASSFDVRIKILSNSFLDDKWDRSHAYDEKGTSSPRSVVCPK